MFNTLFTFGSNILSQLGVCNDNIGTSKKPLNVQFDDDEEINNTIIPENQKNKKTFKDTNKTHPNTQIKQISTGSLHTLVLTNDNLLYSFGCNDEGALGRTGDEQLAKQVILPTNDKIIKIETGQSSSFCLTEKNELYGWGVFRDSTGIIGFICKNRLSNKPIRKPVLLYRNVFDIFVGFNHLIMKNKKGLYAIGTNEFGEKGLPNLRRMSKLQQIGPVLIANRRSYMYKKPNFFLGNSTTFYCDSSQTLSWGKNNTGQLGTGNQISSHVKREVFTQYHIDQENFNLENKTTNLNENNFIENNQLIENKNILDPIQKVTSGETHTLFLTENNNIYFSGDNTFGQSGIEHVQRNKDSKIAECITKPEFVMANVKDMKCKGFFSIVENMNNEFYAWGFNPHGECSFEGDAHIPRKMDLDINVSRWNVGHDFSVFAGEKISKDN